jgi:hypothetical protein
MVGKLGTKFDACTIFKPNAPLAKVEDIGKLGKGLTKQDQGPGNSLERNVSLFN